jgi:predicted permease
VVFVAMAGMAAGILLAVGPALWASRVVVIEALRDTDPRSNGGVMRARRALVAAQVALSLALVVGAALFSRTLTALADADLGFPRAQLVAMDFDLEPSSPPASALPALAREALNRARSVPGIRAAAMASRAPVDQSSPTADVRTAPREGVLLSDVTFYLVTAGYFDTVGIPLLAGRAFSPAESESRADVVVVNASLATAFWPGGDAIDRVIYVAGTALRVVGVARDAKYRSINESGRPHFYRPTPPALGLTLLARTADDPRAALRALQQALDTVGPGLVGFFPRTLDDHLAIDLLPTRVAAAAATGLSAVALGFSGIGLFGLVSWFVTMRSREIGIRLALGASAGSIRTLIVGQAVRTALPGLLVGAFLAAALALLARTTLFGVGPLDPAAFAAGTGALVIVVAAAAYGPSRRASHMDAASLFRD